MRTFFLRRRFSFLLGIVPLAASTSFAAGISASGTIADVQISPGNYAYTVTLDNIGTTTIGTFWFSWVPGAGFLSAVPTSIGSPTGWSDILTNGGAAIQWTTSTLLPSGQSLAGFTFDSTETPADMLGIFSGPGTGTGDPVTTSFVYIAAPLADPGFQFALTPVPLPGAAWLIVAGLGGLGVFARRKNAA